MFLMTRRTPSRSLAARLKIAGQARNDEKKLMGTGFVSHLKAGDFMYSLSGSRPPSL